MSPVQSPIRLSVAIIARNEAHRIERCLRSVAFADEIVVLDSGSADDTVAIARRCGARVEVSDGWPGYGPQKNRALALTRGEWVLSIDADEEVTPELAAAIREAVAQPRFDGYWVRRASTFCGRVIRHGDWRNDRVLRLFRRAVGRFSDDVVHERVLVPAPHGELAGLLLHDSVDSIEDGRRKMLEYARLGAARLRARGRGGLVSACLHGGWTFVRGYLLRLGILDGWRGLMIARLNARGTYLRYRLAGSAADESTLEHTR
ncbi:MAG TPA: glycosyltransferase family 2 protein [Burkholderiaceae bacterium]|nr:glycosyltransferase family 2 protein [Burkholderiaceae bacterium]